MTAAGVPAHLPARQVFRHAHTCVGAERLVVHGHGQCHDHSFMELVVVLAGAGTHPTFQGDQPLGRGDALVLRSRTWHAYVACQALDVFNCYVREDLLQRDLSWCQQDPLLGRLFRPALSTPGQSSAIHARLDEPAIRCCLEQLVALEAMGAQAELGGRAAPVGHLLLLLSCVARCVEHVPDGANRMVPPAVLRCIQVFESDLAGHWTLGALAAVVGLNVSYLVRLFVRATGVPPIGYFRQLRLERAATVLIQTDRPVADSAADAGWPDANLFTRRFRSHLGVPPSTYRRQWMSESPQASSAPGNGHDLMHPSDWDMAAKNAPVSPREPAGHV